MQHLDEGTIHTWLDGQLPRDEAAAVEAHVAECRQCADAVAEARGLIAASSRILTALDGVPRAAREPSAISRQTSVTSVAQTSAQSAATRAQRRWFRGPSLAAAATIVVAVGTFALMRAGSDGLVSAPGAADATSERASGPSVADSASFAVAAPTQSPAPAAPPPAANEARDAVATAREGFADGARPAESGQPLRRLSEPAVPGSQQPLAAQQKLQKMEPPAEQAATSQQERDEARLRQRVAAQAPAPAAVVAVPPAARADTSRVQVFRGSRQEVKAFSMDSGRQDAAKVAADAAVATGSIRGRVTDANRTGIEGAMVAVENTSIGVPSSRTGEFELNGVPAGAQRITARRLGYEPATRPVTVSGSQVVTTDITLAPATNRLSEVVTTSAATVEAQRGVGSTRAASAPGTAHGCYDLGVTPGSSQARTDFRQVPRRIALDSAVVPGRSDGIWYQVRDLTRGGVVNGVWRPTPPDGIEVQWTYGNRTATLRLTGVAGAVLRGTVEEIDRVSATGDAATVVAGKSRCDVR